MSYRQRSEWIEEAKTRVLQNTKRTDEATQELIFLYDEAAYNVEKEINALFARFARDNNLTDAQASQLLSGKEYSTWRKSVQEYMKEAKEASEAAQDSKTMLELNTLAMKSRISQKERLLANIYQNMIDLAEDSSTKLEDVLGDMLKVNYYESCFSIQRGIGLGFNVARIDDKLLRQVLSSPWSEKHFSTSVWGNCDKISALVKREITLGFIQGSGVQKMVKAINDVMDKGRYNTVRLVRTECKSFANQGEMMAYKENGIKRYRFIGGTEGSGSCHCAEKNGQVFDVEGAKPGIDYPPLHPNCLCIIVADFGDKGMFSQPADAQPLPENIKFQEWKEKYVDGSAQSGIIPLSGDEERALRAYVSSDSYKINDKLRRGAALTRRDRQFIEFLDQALDKLPEVQGTIYRSLSKGLEIDDVDAFVADYIIGVPKPFKAYTSASLEVYDESMEIQYVITAKHAKNISLYNQGEKEILFKRDTVFVPTNIDGHTIYMEEV